MLSKPSASSDAVVLRAWSCGETSVIASFLTADHGFVKVVAKAARRPRSRLRPLVEPGRLIHAEFSLDPERELQYLRGGSVRLDPTTEGVDLERTAYLLAALELVDRCRPPSTSDPSGPATALFGVCDGFIGMLSSGTGVDPARLFFAFEWLLLKNHGLDPEVMACAACGEDSFQAAEGGNLWFRPADGGVVCGHCGTDGGAGRPLSRAALAEFQAYDSGAVFAHGHPPLEKALRREVGAHLHRFLGFHLPGYRLPVALDLLRPIPRAEESSS